jgi:hypothetical protein
MSMHTIAADCNAIPHPVTGEIIRTGINWDWCRFGTESDAQAFLKLVKGKFHSYSKGARHGFVIVYQRAAQ